MDRSISLLVIFNMNTASLSLLFLFFSFWVKVDFGPLMRQQSLIRGDTCISLFSTDTFFWHLLNCAKNYLAIRSPHPTVPVFRRSVLFRLLYFGYLSSLFGQLRANGNVRGLSPLCGFYTISTIQ